MKKISCVMVVAVAVAGMVTAQDTRRRASINRGAVGGGEGCIVDVIVDGAAEIEIRGDDAIMRNLSGQPPQFRQFDCTRPMPPNAAGFQFIEVDGRGRQELVRTPAGGGPVVVRIDDPQGGAGEYRFQLTWIGARGYQGGYLRREQGDRGYVTEQDGDREHLVYQQERDRYFQGNAWRQTLFQRVREDVEHLQRTTFPFTGDQSRLSRTIFELNELQGKLSDGRFDEHELNDVMGALGAVLQNNRISARDRDVLSDDLRRMREFRDHHDDYGARFPRN